MRLVRAAAAVLLAASLADPVRAQPGFVPVDVTATPITEFELADPDTGFGTVSFRGGLVLHSDDPEFGALSGLDFLPDGRLVAIADTGFWFTARLIEEGGRLIGIAGVERAPMLDEDGEESARKVLVDAEGMRLIDDGRTALVSFEQRHRVSRYPTADLGSARPAAVTVPALPGLSGNRGIEAVAMAPADGPLEGAVVLISEGATDGAGGIRGWIAGGPRAGSFSVRGGDYDITDAAFLPNGDLFILERRFSLLGGIAMRIRRLSANDIRPGARVDGPVILSDNDLAQIDNMEGMALRRGPSGEVLITLVSDDNHSILQRTLILQFAWVESAPPLPRPRPEPVAAPASGGG